MKYFSINSLSCMMKHKSKTRMVFSGVTGFAGRDAQRSRQ